MPTHSLMAGLQLHEPYHFVQESDPGAVGSSKYWLQVSTGTVRRRNLANNAWTQIGGATGLTFTQLGDVPASYAGQANKLVSVNPAATGLEFTEPTADAFTELSDTPSSYAGQAGKVVTVNAGATGLEFTTPAGGGGTLPTWLSLHPDNPPAVPNAMDDEFDSVNTLPGGSTPKWTWDGQGGATVAIVSHVLNIFCPATGNNQMRMLYQTLPASPWEFTAKVAYNSMMNVNYHYVGLSVIDSISDRRREIKIIFDSSNQISVFGWGNTTNVSVIGNGTPWPTRQAYLRIRNNGANNIFSFSNNGIVWIELQNESQTAWLSNAPNRIGIWAGTNNGTWPNTGTFEWFRRTL